MDEFKRTLYDAVQENFKVAGRKHYIHRIIYIGEHKYAEPRDAFQQYMAEKIKTLHEGYCDEGLTGFLLAYPAHFVHLVEGSEDTLMRHLRDVCADDELLTRMKILLVTYHINQRYYPKWGYSICHPPILYEKLDPECPLEETARQTKICIDKLYRLTKNFLQQSATTFKYIAEALTDRYPAMLPECALLEFLLGSKTLRDLRQYAANYRTVMDVCGYDNTVWPVACEYVPTNVLASLPVSKPKIASGDDGDDDDDLLAADTEGEGEETEAHAETHAEDKETSRPAGGEEKQQEQEQQEQEQQGQQEEQQANDGNEENTL